jgi:glycosyltransferase involved in cell wall biosynthesis
MNKMNRPSIGLCMIVKNEAPVILRCLQSVRPLIDTWLIVDTGSTDGTQDIIRSFFSDIPGRLVERPWLNFAHNRSEALSLAQDLADYSLIIDADDRLVVADDFDIQHLVADTYSLDIVFGAIRYRRPQLISNRLPWRYEGVIHEFLSLPDPNGKEVRSNHEIDQRFLPGVEIHIGEDGARRRTDDSSRFRRDANVIENALHDERDPFLVSRYTFYLAQSYEQGGEAELALDAYLRRAEQGFWRDEVFMSLYRAAMIMERIGRPEDEVLEALDRATASHPQRAEALFAASRLCRRLGRFVQGYEYACRGLRIERPADGLFVVQWIYDYGLLDELSVNAFWCGEYRDSVRASRRLLQQGLIPTSEVDRIKANLGFSLDKLLPLNKAAGSSASTDPASATSEDLLARAHVARIEAASPDHVVSAFRAEIVVDCNNLTSYHDAARYCREQNLFELGYRFAQDGLARLHPDARTDEAGAIARHCLHDEFAVNAYWSGRYLDCMLACRVILARRDLDDRLRSRVEDNLRFAQERLGLPSPESRSLLQALESGQVSIMLATPADDPSWRELDDIANTLTAGFRRLGLVAHRVTNSLDASGLCILLGAHLLSSNAASELSDDVIVFNTEHHSSHWIRKNAEYCALLSARQVWDYREANAESLRNELGGPVTVVEIGSVPDLRRVESSLGQQIDVLSYTIAGSRHRDALNVIARSGLSVVSGINIPGDLRAELLAHSKVVVHAHVGEYGAIDLPQINYLLAKGKAVVAECTAEDAIDADLRAALCAVPSAELAEACISLATDKHRRRELEGAAIAYSLERQQDEILRKALFRRPTHRSL